MVVSGGNPKMQGTPKPRGRGFCWVRPGVAGRRRRAPGQDEDSGFQTRPLEQAASCYRSHRPEGHDATQTYRSHQRKSQASFHIFQDPHF